MLELYHTKNLAGLSNVCATVLGKPLDKTCQISNWKRRPLTESQTAYAALDVLCLIDIYDRLQSHPASPFQPTSANLDPFESSGKLKQIGCPTDAFEIHASSSM